MFYVESFSVGAVSGRGVLSERWRGKKTQVLAARSDGGGVD